MNILRYTIVLTVVTMSTACSDSPFLTEEEARKAVDELIESRDSFYAVRNVVAVINNDIWYFDKLADPPRRVTFSPDETKTLVRLSFDHTRIAYLNDSEVPVIIRADDGAVLETLTGMTYTTDMDWLRDRNTLYILRNDQITFHGEAVEIIEPQLTHPWDRVYSFSMNSIGDQGYFKLTYGYAYPDLYFNSASKELSKVTHFERCNYIEFYGNAGNFLLGRSADKDTRMEYVFCLQNYNFWAAYEWDYEDMNTPTFNGELELLLYGILETKPYRIKSVYLGEKNYVNHGLYDRLTHVLEEYPSNTPIYLDWVQ